MIALSILELVRVTQETDARGALKNARDLAAHAEGWGYRRNLGRGASQHGRHRKRGDRRSCSPTSPRARRRIRVGAGGIMLPNHAPYIIAEQFGTLAQLFPGRIDLGLGRAPGTDQLTLRALRRSPDGRGDLSRRT